MVVAAGKALNLESVEVLDELWGVTVVASAGELTERVGASTIEGTLAYT